MHTREGYNDHTFISGVFNIFSIEYTPDEGVSQQYTSADEVLLKYAIGI